MNRIRRLLIIVPPYCSTPSSEMFDFCEAFRTKLQIDAHISFLDTHQPNERREYYHNFNEWVRSNADLINRASIIELEREFGQSHLWKIIVSQRDITDYSYTHGTFPILAQPYDKLLYILKAVVLYYSTLIRNYAFDVVLCNACDNMHSTALFVLSKSMRFRAFDTFISAYSPNNYFLVDSEYLKSKLLFKRYKDNLSNYSSKVEPYLAQLKAVHEDIIHGTPQVSQSFGLFSREHPNNPVTLLTNFISAYKGDERTIGDPLIHDDRAYLCKRIFSKLMQFKNLLITKATVRFEDTLPETPYMYYPLHLQPEATLLATDPAFSDQLAVIRFLSVSLPSGYLLVVKDHPKMPIEFRPTAFYKSIKKLPNVRMLRNDYNFVEVIEKSDMVITLCGTAGFEAALRYKKVLVLTPIYYDSLSNVRYVENIRNLNAIIKDMLFTDMDAGQVEKSIFSFLRSMQEVSYERTSNGNQAEADALRFNFLIQSYLKENLE